MPIYEGKYIWNLCDSLPYYPICGKVFFAEENTKFVYFGNWLLTQFLTGFRSNIWFGFFEILVTVIEHY